MIRTRVLVGSILVAVATGVLLADDHLAPWFPFLFVSLLGLGMLAGSELLWLFPVELRPSPGVTLTGIALCLAVNWVPTLRAAVGASPGSCWPLLVLTSAAVLAAYLLVEMRRYAGPSGQALRRLANGLLVVTYLGLLPSFFAQLRFLPSHAAALLALAVIVPKANDIAAFFTGTFLGRHPMTPLLSPKKTWEGFVGGMLGGVLAAVLASEYLPVFRHGRAEAVAFGLVVGLAGVFGDLAESLLKRECGAKDASRSIPGFGGVLDLLDSVLFAAPVVYLWFDRSLR